MQRRSVLLDEALKRYESKREDIYKEFEISFVQERIRNKLLKKQGSNIDLLFYDNPEESIEEDLEDLISESAEERLEDVERESLEYSTRSIEEVEIKKKKKSSLYDFLDLEAECSNEESKECTDSEDLAEIIDNNSDNSINLDPFIKEKAELDKRALEGIRKQFVKRKRDVTKEIAELDIIEEEDTGSFPEIKDFFADEQLSENMKEEKQEAFVLATATLNKKLKIFDDNVFENDGLALKRLEKQEEQRGTGFIRKKDN
ncbi:hypothetical protein GINT2_001461 [Glugoides intestinalis]